jgi:hypothetical protein
MGLANDLLVLVGPAALRCRTPLGHRYQDILWHHERCELQYCKRVYELNIRRYQLVVFLPHASSERLSRKGGRLVYAQVRILADIDGLSVS